MDLYGNIEENEMGVCGHVGRELKYFWRLHAGVMLRAGSGMDQVCRNGPEKSQCFNRDQFHDAKA